MSLGNGGVPLDCKKIANLVMRFQLTATFTPMKSIYVRLTTTPAPFFSIESRYSTLLFQIQMIELKGTIAWIFTNVKIYMTLYIIPYYDILCLNYFSHTCDCCSDKWLRFCLSRTVNMPIIYVHVRWLAVIEKAWMVMESSHYKSWLGFWGECLGK